jgi:hypothetical protein
VGMTGVLLKENWVIDDTCGSVMISCHVSCFVAGA